MTPRSRSGPDAPTSPEPDNRRFPVNHETRCLRMGLCGLGAWGRNVARAFSSVENARLEIVCDLEPARAGDEHDRHHRKHEDQRAKPEPEQAQRSQHEQIEGRRCVGVPPVLLVFSMSGSRTQ